MRSRSTQPAPTEAVPASQPALGRPPLGAVPPRASLAQAAARR